MLLQTFSKSLCITRFSLILSVCLLVYVALLYCAIIQFRRLQRRKTCYTCRVLATSVFLWRSHFKYFIDTNVQILIQNIQIDIRNC